MPATPHAGVLSDCLTQVSFDMVVDRLRAWRPDLIAIEWLGPTTIDTLVHRNDEFGRELRDNFASRTHAAGLAARLHR